jgi:hypothetical protein
MSVRLILDTNLWSYIADRDESRQLEELEDELGLTLIIPPSVLLEALDTPVEQVRARIISALAKSRRSRVHPLPEARQEAGEVVEAIRELRPRWVRQFPRADRIPSLEKFWTKTVWQLAERDAAELSRRSAATPTPGELDHLIEVQRSNKDAAKASDFRLDGEPPWAEIPAELGELRKGWDETRVQEWRVTNAIIWWENLITLPASARAVFAGADTTLADWVGPWIDLERVRKDRGDWNRFWYRDVEVAAVPRNWLRQVLPWIQMETKIGVGNPRDAQHSSYLFDADVFATADRRYAGCLETARQWSPVPFARTLLLPATGSTVQALRAALLQPV